MRAATPAVLLAATALLAGCPSPAREPAPPPQAQDVSTSPTPRVPDPSDEPSPSPSPSPTPATFSQTYEDVNSGVLRIDVETCSGSGSGTGFLIAPDLVATVAHVVDSAATVRITQGTRSTSATVLGLDEPTDTALLRTSSDLEGHVFELSDDGPAVGERIGVIGFPVGDSGLITGAAGSKSFKEGSVNGLGRKAEIDGSTRTDLVELDALARSGNSGSPVLQVDGDVVGLLSAGPADDDAARARFAVSSSTALPLLEQWQEADEPVEPQSCTGLVGPDGEPVDFTQLPGGESREVAATLNLYFNSINQGDYDTAYAQKHPDAQSASGLEAFRDGVRTSRDTDISYNSLVRSGRDLVVWVTFTSEQDPAYGPDGHSCVQWSLDHTLRQSDGLWLIVDSTPHGEEPYVPCPESG